jgi:hypothetical protein
LAQQFIDAPCGVVNSLNDGIDLDAFLSGLRDQSLKSSG